MILRPLYESFGGENVVGKEESIGKIRKHYVSQNLVGVWVSKTWLSLTKLCW